MIIAQNSTPKIYSVNPPAEAIELLKNELRTVYEAKFKDADELIDTLTLMYEANNENEVSEVAYIIRSYPAIIKRMNKLIKDSKKYVMVLINDESILEGLSGALKEAAHKGVLDIALPKGLLEVAPKELKAVKLFCPCNIVVSDSRNLITLSEIPNRSALLLNDRTLIEAVKQYFKKNR